MEGYFDICGNQHQPTELIAEGGQGYVYRTANPDIAIKLELNSETKELLTDPTENKKFLKLGLLPLPQGIPVTLPLVVLRDHVGYAMSLLGDMRTFTESFSQSMEAFPVIEELLAEKSTSSVMDLNHIPNHPWLDQFFPDNTSPETPEVLERKEELLRRFYTYIETGGKRRRLQAYYKTACIFSQLHSRGLVFCDFSPNNIFLSTELDYCQVWLIDADNINYQSITWERGGYKTPEFTAPEIGLNTEGSSMYSDLYSFALSLFYQLTGTHPFKGNQFYEEEPLDQQQESYHGPLDEFGTVAELLLDEGVFPWILDQDDDRNEYPTKIDAEILLSPKLLALFHRSFSEKGRKKSTTRPRAVEWAWALAEELDTSAVCPHCHMEFPLVSHETGECPWCDHQFPVIEIISYHYFPQKGSLSEKKGTPLWRFAQECTGEIPLPTRLLYGQYVRNKQGALEETAFFSSITPEEEGFVWTCAGSSVSIARLEEGGRLSPMSGTIKIPDSQLTLVCEEDSLGRKVLLEVNIR